MKIIRNDWNSGSCVIEAEVNLERGWFKQYPEYSIVIQTISPVTRLAERFYSRPGLTWEIGPGTKIVTGVIQFPFPKGQKFIVLFYTRETPDSIWVLRYNVAVIAGDSALVETPTESVMETLKPLIYAGLAITGLIAGARIIEAVKS